MDYKQPRLQPEQAGAKRLKTLMQRAGWEIDKTHGNVYMKGWPDYYAAHKRFGTRWIETKASGTGQLSLGQIEFFNRWTRAGVGIWVLRDEKDYPWLFERPNWHLWIDPLSRPHSRRE